MQAKKVSSGMLFPKMGPDAGKENTGCQEEDSYQFLSQPLRDDKRSSS